MCLMCEEDAFFRAYWEQVRSLAPGDGQQGAAAPAPADASRFTATAVEDAASAPARGAQDAAEPESGEKSGDKA